ncbi:MAG: hypothetical protein Tsb0020_03600 [Haliangiales bacterium]
MQRPSLAAFCVLTYCVTWGFQLGFIATGQPLGAPLSLLLLTLAAVAPSLVAVAISWHSGGRAAAAALWGPPGWSRCGWSLAALALRPTTIAIAAGLGMLLGGPAPSAGFSLFALGSALVASFGEELGWRGFAYSRLVDRWERTSPALGVVWANLSLGLLWALWHLPTAFFPGAGGIDGTFARYVALVVGMSVLIGWVFERSGRRTMIAVIAHMGINLSLLRLPAGALTATCELLVVLGLAALAGADLVRIRRASAHR